MNLAEEVSRVLYWLMVQSTNHSVSSSVKICPAVMQLDSSITEVHSRVLFFGPLNSCLVTRCYGHLA